MQQELKIPNPDNPNQSFYQRVFLGELETVREDIETTNEINNNNYSGIRQTIETITITRTTLTAVS